MFHSAFRIECNTNASVFGFRESQQSMAPLAYIHHPAQTMTWFWIKSVQLLQLPLVFETKMRRGLGLHAADPCIFNSDIWQNVHIFIHYSVCSLASLPQVSQVRCF